MSSSSNSSPSPSSSIQGSGNGKNNDLGFREALIIGAALMAMMVFFVILRYSCNWLIDVVILDEMERIKRHFAQAVRTLCPRWHVRTNPDDETRPTSTRVNAATNHSSTRTTTTAPHPGQGVIRASSSCVVALTSKILTKQDLMEHNARYCRSHRSSNNVINSNSSTTTTDGENMLVESTSSSTSYCIMCSICLHELFAGDCVVFVGDCNHMFHKDCMLQWVAVSQRQDCPNCRSEIIPSSSSRAAVLATVDMGDVPPPPP